MPWGDGTGPAGMGPMTGRAAGYCAGYPVPGFMNPTAGRGILGAAPFAYQGSPYPGYGSRVAGYPYAGYGAGRVPTPSYVGGPVRGFGRGMGFRRGMGAGRRGFRRW